MEVISQIKKHSLFASVFALAKATVYSVPLFLADALSRTDFGILEYALAGLGMVVNTVINLGVPGAYPYFILREKRLELQPSFKLHVLVLLIPFVINQILFFFFELNINFYLAFNVSYIIANQVFYSTQLKSHEKSIVAVILDSGLYIVLLVYYIFSLFGLVAISINAINVFIILYAMGYVFYSIYNFFKHKNQILINGYKIILRFSVHLLISTFLIFLITTSGRILVEYFFDFEAVGVYAFYFRLAAIVVMIYQVINILFFKKLYTLSPLLLDEYYFKFFLFIYTLSVLIFFISPYIVGEFSDFFAHTFQSYKNIYFLLSAQMVVWIATALNSSIIDREKLAAKNNIKFLGLSVVALIVFYFCRNQMDLQFLVLIHFTIISTACLIQYFSLYKKNIIFRKSALTIASLYLFTIGYYYLILCP